MHQEKRRLYAVMSGLCSKVISVMSGPYSKVIVRKRLETTWIYKVENIVWRYSGRVHFNLQDPGQEGGEGGAPY